MVVESVTIFFRDPHHDTAGDEMWKRKLNKVKMIENSQ